MAPSHPHATLVAMYPASFLNRNIDETTINIYITKHQNRNFTRGTQQYSTLTGQWAKKKKEKKKEREGCLPKVGKKLTDNKCEGYFQMKKLYRFCLMCLNHSLNSMIQICQSDSPLYGRLLLFFVIIYRRLFSCHTRLVGSRLASHFCTIPFFFQLSNQQDSILSKVIARLEFFL